MVKTISVCSSVSWFKASARLRISNDAMTFVTAIRHAHKYITTAAVAADSELTCLFSDSRVMLRSPHHPPIHLSIHQFLDHPPTTQDSASLNAIFACDIQGRNISILLDVLPFKRFSRFLSVAVNIMYKLQFYSARS